MFISKLVSSIIKATKREHTVNGRGAKDPRTAYEVAPYGVDAVPPKGWKALYMHTEAADTDVIIGYVNESAIMDHGDTRLYSEGDLDIRIKKNSTIEIGGDADNMMRYSEMKAAFDQLRSDLNNHIAIFNAHVHAVVSGTATPTATPSTPSSADMSAAKIDEIKTL